MIPDDFEKIYRPSATVIIAAKNSIKEHGYDYRILLAKRTEATAYAPDHHVFPGGVFDAKADESMEWLQHFKKFGITLADLHTLCLDDMPSRPCPLMTNKRFFSRDIALRITAIRETFEEVGVLLCRTREQLKDSHKGCCAFKNFDRPYWQEKIHNNSIEFLNLCKYLDVLPDIWSLKEWSIWRSPPKALKKYDTVLYFVALDEQPEIVLEPNEVERELWVSPMLSLNLFKNRIIWLPPLQFYEICRLSNILNWTELKDFVHKRSNKGSTLLMLAYYSCDDFLVGTLPGDDCYPENLANYTETIKFHGSSADFECNTRLVHRLIYRDMYDMSVKCNISPIDFHLSPIPRLESSVETSKL